MKNIIKEYTPYLLAAIVGCLITVAVYRVKDELKEPELKEGSIVVLGENASIRLAKPKELNKLIEPKAVYHKRIKIEIGQVWACCEDDSPPLLTEITDIKTDTIEYIIYSLIYNPRPEKHLKHLDSFFKTYPELLSTKEGYVTMKGEVRNINTSDLTKN